MSRAEVTENQTQRILAAMRDMVAAHGYEHTTVDRVVDRAGVSRKTYYELGGGREWWFVTICEEVASRMLAQIDAAIDPSAEPPERARRAAAAFVEFCLDDPVGTRNCFVESLAASASARAMRTTLIDRVARAIARAATDDTDPSDGARGVDRHAELAARAIVGAVVEIAGRHPERLDRDYAAALVATLLATGGEDARSSR